MSNRRDAAGLLRRAKQKIEKYGWVQQDFGGEDRGYCVVGAMRVATRTSAEDHLNWSALLVLHELLPIGSNLVNWNDHPRRTKKQVLEMFDRAIALALK